jgi:A/G-specific adenine glycosylase
VKSKTQSWHGTDRKCRGTVVQALRENKKLTMKVLQELWGDEDQMKKAVKTLLADGLIETIGQSYKLAD